MIYFRLEFNFVMLLWKRFGFLVIHQTMNAAADQIKLSRPLDNTAPIRQPREL